MQDRSRPRSTPIGVQKAATGTNEYPFLINDEGISVLPITSLGLAHDVSSEQVSTGIPSPDELFAGGGFYRGSSVLLSGTAGIGIELERWHEDGLLHIHARRPQPYGLCEEHLNAEYEIEIVDLRQNPKLAHDDQIFAIPTPVRKLPEPMRKLIGDLSNTERVLVGLDLRPPD